MFKILDLEQDTPEWHEFRKGKLGASYAATLVDYNPYQTQLQLYEDIVFDRKKSSNAHMRRGKEEEPKAREWFNKWIGKEFKPVVVQSTSNSKLFASLDGFNQEEGIGCEIKTPGISPLLEMMIGNVPDLYEWQIQYQMMITDAPKWWCLGWNYHGQSGYCIETKRDEDKITMLKEAALVFLERLEKHDPPKETEKDWRCILDEKIVSKGDELRRNNELIKKMKEINDGLKKEIEEYVESLDASPCSRFEIGGVGKFYKSSTGRMVDYSKVPELKGVDLEPYRKDATEYWTFKGT